MRSAGHNPARWRIAAWVRARRAHPTPVALSRYLDGDRSAAERAEVQAHVRECAPCRRLLESLSETVRGLGTLRRNEAAGRADRIIAALSATDGRPRLTVVGDHDTRVADDRRRPAAATAVRYCLQRSQLRITAPMGLFVGVALSLANKGAMLFEGDVDLKMCVVCGLDFLLPFIGMNVALLTATRILRRR